MVSRIKSCRDLWKNLLTTRVVGIKIIGSLRMNPKKIIIVPFTGRGKICFQPASIEGRKYWLQWRRGFAWQLTVIELYQLLMEVIIEASPMCRRLLGKSWSLKPQSTLLPYTAILRSKITYAALVWSPKIT